MKTGTKIWLIVAAALVLVGGGLFVVTMTMIGWDFSKLSTVKYETNKYDISEDFNGISIRTETSDVAFVLSDDGKCRVECYEEEDRKHSVSVKDGTLTVERAEKDIFGHIGFNFSTPKITVYLQKTEYEALLIKASTGDIEIPKAFTFLNADISLSTGDVAFCATTAETVKIKASTGKVKVEDTSVGALDITVTTGNVSVCDVTCGGEIKVGVSTGKTNLVGVACKSLVSSGNTGDITLKNVIAEASFYVKRSTGDVTFEGSDAAEIFVQTSTGDVEGSLLSSKVFIANTDTGKVDVPKSITGGRCEITTDTGDIRISVINR